tara:strand:- start:1230 stop:2342 length:1113 start_codon:yes stop_codon:yes gene_type:complete
MASYIGKAPPTLSGVVNRFKYTASGSQTAFTGADGNGATLFYESNNPVLVFMNGIQLVEGVDFTKTSDTVLTLASGAAANDIIEILSFGSFNLSNATNLKSQLLLGTAADLNVGTSQSNIPQLDSNGKILNSVLNLGTSANNIVQLNGSGALPAVDGSNLTGVTETKPTITGISPSTITNAQTAVTISGANYASVPIVQAINSTGAITFADTVAFTNATTIVANFTLTTDGSYFIRVENPNGLAVRSSSALLNVSDAPTWTTSAGSLGTVAAGSSVSLTVAATGDSNVTISETTSVLTSNSNTPAGTMNLTLSGSAATSASYTISGTAPSPSSAQTYTFTLRATDAESQTADRQFTITVSVGASGGGQFN